MTKYLLIVAMFHTYAYTQNLVINPSFEKDATPQITYTNGLIGEEMHWWEANNATIDLFGPINRNCLFADTIIMKAHQGANYLGAIVSETKIINYSEILQGQLIKPLQKNKKYLIGAYVRFGIVSHYKSSDYSFGFSKKKQYERLFFNRFAVRKASKKIPVDSISGQWKFISSVYQAKGNEKYVVFGSLRRKINLPNTTKTNPPALKYQYLPGAVNHAYIDLDDVFVIELPENYDSIREKSFSFDQDQQLALIPRKGDAVTLNSGGFKKEDWRLNDSLVLTMNTITDYLKENPFITIELTLPDHSQTQMSQLDRLRNRRAQSLESYFEKNGISYNRIHLQWNESLKSDQITLAIHDVLYR